MSQFHSYLAEEVAEDLNDGIISRREAMRRLGLLGLTASAAGALLGLRRHAGRGGRRDDGPARGRGSNRSLTNWAPVATESLTFTGPRSPLLAAWAPHPNREAPSWSSTRTGD